MTPEQQELFDGMTDLQKRMVTLALDNVNLSQRQVYLLAGGKGKTDEAQDASACEIFGNLRVKAFMDSIRTQAVSNAIMTREEAMKELSAMSRGRLTDIVKFKTVFIGKDMETGADVNQTAWEIDEDLQQSDPDKLIIISELEVGKFGPKIKTHSKIAAIQQLAKMQGWEAAQKVDHSSSDGTMSPKAVDAELVAALVGKLID